MFEGLNLMVQYFFKISVENPIVNKGEFEKETKKLKFKLYCL